jgi:hypothetical protein
MTLKDRFRDFWNDTNRYNLSVFEIVTYGIAGALGMAVMFAVLLVMWPIWIVPYLIYLAIKYRRKSAKEAAHD